MTKLTTLTINVRIGDEEITSISVKDSEKVQKIISIATGIEQPAEKQVVVHERGKSLRSCKIWSKEENDILSQMFHGGKSDQKIADTLGRSENAVSARLYVLGLRGKKETSEEFSQAKFPIEQVIIPKQEAV